jgi:hypothetical protein
MKTNSFSAEFTETQRTQRPDVKNNKKKNEYCTRIKFMGQDK